MGCLKLRVTGGLRLLLSDRKCPCHADFCGVDVEKCLWNIGFYFRMHVLAFRVSRRKGALAPCRKCPSNGDLCEDRQVAWL